MSGTCSLLQVVSLNQKVPAASDVCELSPSENGRFVAILSLQCVFIVELHRDFWNCQSLLNSTNLDNFRKSYNAE